MMQSDVRLRLLIIGLTVGLVAAGFLAVAAAPGKAFAPGSFSVYGCSLNGGHISEPAGIALEARGGWGAKTHGLVQDFLNAQVTTLSVNKGPAISMDPYFAPIVHDGPDAWSVHFFYPLPALRVGQSVTVVETLVIQRHLIDGESFLSDANNKKVDAAGMVVWTCTVTGV